MRKEYEKFMERQYKLLKEISKEMDNGKFISQGEIEKEFSIHKL